MMATTEDMEPCKLLLQCILNNNARNLECILQKHPELVDAKLKTQAGQLTPLITACHSGSLALVRILIKHGADICATGHMAGGVIRLNHSCERIIHSVGRSVGGYGAFDGIFPLFVATKRSCLAVMEELLFAGAPVNQTNSIRQSALHVASMNYDGSSRLVMLNSSSEETSLQVMRTLIENGANVNLQDTNGKTPLHYACEHGNRFLVKILLEKSADVSMKDNHGLSALDIAASHDYQVTQTIIEKCHLSPKQIIEAYETVAAINSDPLESLLKATELRKRHKIPKTILEPLECYGFVREWKTAKELKVHEGDYRQLRLHAILARERIFQGRYVNFMAEEGLNGILQTQRNRLNSVLQHHLDLYEKNEDHLYFADVFVMHDSLLIRLLHPAFAIDNDTLAKTVKIAIDSGLKMQEALQSETRHSVAQELISQLETTLVTVGVFILKLLDSANLTGDEIQCDLAKVIFKDIYEAFPSVICPLLRYKAPLPHVLFCNKYKAFLFTVALSPSCLQYQLELMKMFLDAGIDTNLTDSDGNTLLHVILSSLPNDFKWYSRDLAGGNSSDLCAKTTGDIVTLLLESGIYIYARNKSRMMAIQILNDPMYIEVIAAQVADLIKKYDCFPTLQQMAAQKIIEFGMPYHNHLPETLVQFVDLH